MKKKIMTLMVAAAVSISVLSGCRGGAEPVDGGGASDTVTAERTEAECTHTWTEATFASPKTCTLCGETEGEPKQSYFNEHGAKVADAPVACTVNGVIYNHDNPEVYQMITDAVWEQIDCYSEPAEEDGYRLIHLELCLSLQNYYDAAQDIVYDSGIIDAGIYDWYTGRMLPARVMSGNDAFDYSITLDIDGISYDVSYTQEVQWEFGDIVFADNGDATKLVKGYHAHIFKVPEGYDGLVFAAIPANEYVEPDTETVIGTTEENAEYIFDEGYIDGTKFFRINKEGTVPERVAEDTEDTAE